MTNEFQTTSESLRLQLKQSMAKIESERLPGWEAFFAADPKIGGWLDGLQVRVENAIRDKDKIRFEKEMSSIVKAWGRVNELVAEDYRKNNKDPELWELRYIKWMKIAYIRFGSKRGDFYLLPRNPQEPPQMEHWYTVDEMLVFVRPEVAAIIALSDKLPQKSAKLMPPGPGEKVLHVDATGPTAKVYYELHKRPRYG